MQRLPHLCVDVDGSPLFRPLINFITLSPTPLHLTKKGNNKSLIHYPLTGAAMRKCLITGNKLNFNHRVFPSQDVEGELKRIGGIVC
jgi:hypothetical protein